MCFIYLYDPIYETLVVLMISATSEGSAKTSEGLAKTSEGSAKAQRRPAKVLCFSHADSSLEL